MKVNIQRIPILVCPHCHVEVDGLNYKPLSKAHCPKCGGEVDIPGAFENYLLHQRLRLEPTSAKFRAYDQTLERAVMLRIINPLSDPDLIQNLMDIHRKLSALNHPNIAMVHRVNATDEVVYIEGELLSAGSLRDVMDANQLISEIEALSIIHDVALGMERAHLRGLIHLNLHPAAIRFSNDGTPKVIDFAQHRILEARRHLIGKPEYVSPEAVLYAADAKEADKPGTLSDIFSLGVILYELLTGQSPYVRDESEGEIAIIKRRFREFPEPVTALRDLNDRTAQIVDFMMAPSLEERFQSMREVTDLLYEHIQNLLDETEGAQESRNETVKRILADNDNPYAEESILDVGEKTLAAGLASVISDVKLNPEATVVMKPGVSLERDYGVDSTGLSRDEWPEEAVDEIMADTDSAVATAEPGLIKIDQHQDALSELRSEIEAATLHVAGVTGTGLPSVTSRSPSGPNGLSHSPSSFTTGSTGTYAASSRRTHTQKQEGGTQFFTLVIGVLLGVCVGVAAVFMLIRANNGAGSSAADVVVNEAEKVKDPVSSPAIANMTENTDHKAGGPVKENASNGQELKSKLQVMETIAADDSEYLAGMRYQIFTGADALKKKKKGQPVKQGVITKFDLKQIQMADLYKHSAVFSGFLYFSEAGEYVFKIQGTGDVELWSGKKKAKGRRGIPGARREVPAGYYPIKIMCEVTPELTFQIMDAAGGVLDLKPMLFYKSKGK